jgi:hypothetical protein
MTTTERLTRQLEQCHKALLLTADEIEELVKRPGYTAFQRDQWRRAAENLRRFVARQKEGKV